jgi:hypothetical protein
MFNFVKSFFVYKTTNTQTFINKTVYDATINITTNSSMYTEYNCICPPTNKVLIAVNRQDFGNVIAYVNIKYSNGVLINYEFNVKNIDCYDECELYDTYVLFNKEKKGLFTQLVSEPVIEPINEPVIEPINESVIEPINEPVIEQINEPVIEPVSESINESVNEPVNELINKPVNELINKPVSKSINEQINEPINEPVIEPVSESINESVSESINEPVCESINEPVSESINKKKCKKCGKYGHLAKNCHIKKHKL